MKKLSIFTLTLLLLIFCCGVNTNASYYYPSGHYLHRHCVVRVISGDYNNNIMGASDHSQHIYYHDKVINHRINSYLNSIKNISKYHVSIRPTNISDGIGNGDDDEILNETIVLTRK